MVHPTNYVTPLHSRFAARDKDSRVCSASMILPHHSLLRTLQTSSPTMTSSIERLYGRGVYIDVGCGVFSLKVHRHGSMIIGGGAPVGSNATSVFFQPHGDLPFRGLSIDKIRSREKHANSVPIIDSLIQLYNSRGSYSHPSDRSPRSPALLRLSSWRVPHPQAAPASQL